MSTPALPVTQVDQLNPQPAPASPSGDQGSGQAAPQPQPSQNEVATGDAGAGCGFNRSEEHTSELQSQSKLVCRLQLEKKNEKSSPSFHQVQWGAGHVHKAGDSARVLGCADFCGNRSVLEFHGSRRAGISASGRAAGTG